MAAARTISAPPTRTNASMGKPNLTTTGQTESPRGVSKGPRDKLLYMSHCEQKTLGEEMGGITQRETIWLPCLPWRLCKSNLEMFFLVAPGPFLRASIVPDQTSPLSGPNVELERVAA